MANDVPKSGDWQDVSGDFMVRFSNPCQQNYAVVRGQRYMCSCENRAHGHLILSRDGMVGVVPFPIQSLAGFTKLLEILLDKLLIDDEEWEAIWSLNLTQRLRGAMTAEESVILNDPHKLEVAINFVYMGI